MKVAAAQAQYDVVIIGGGLVGASFACMLAHKDTSRPIRILVTEAIESIQASTSFDARSTALSYGSQQLYAGLGLWEALAAYSTPIHKIHVSDRGRFGAARISHTEMGVEALGSVVENQHLGIVLTQALENAETIDYLCPAKITQLTPTPEGMQLQLQGREGEVQSIEAALVVLADGGKSSLSASLGVSQQVTHYEQSAIIANIAFSDDHHHVAYERFTDSGPLAVLPLQTLQGQSRGALVWTVPQDEASTTMALSDADFLKALQARFGHRLGMLTKVGARASYPLRLSVANEQVRPGLVLLGNVAHSLHPVAGQGLNLALRDADVLAQILAQASSSGRALGQMSLLQEYESMQTGDQLMTTRFSHYMTRLFSNNHPALVWARKFGLFSIDLVPPFKRGFARQAMGLVTPGRRSA